MFSYNSMLLDSFVDRSFTQTRILNDENNLLYHLNYVS